MFFFLGYEQRLLLQELLEFQADTARFQTQRTDELVEVGFVRDGRRGGRDDFENFDEGGRLALRGWFWARSPGLLPDG